MASHTIGKNISEPTSHEISNQVHDALQTLTQRLEKAEADSKMWKTRCEQEEIKCHARVQRFLVLKNKEKAEALRKVEDKLKEADELCGKLVDSGLYWRAQRKRKAEEPLPVRLVPVKITCGDGGGRCLDGSHCQRSTYLKSNGKCRDH